MPASLILQAEGVSWILFEEDLPSNLPDGIDRRGLFQLGRTYLQLRFKEGDGYVAVKRTSFQVTLVDTVIAHSAQGSTYGAVVVDMIKPPRMDARTHWLACYVMLSRASSIHGLLVLRPATRKELTTKHPQHLIDEIDRL